MPERATLTREQRFEIGKLANRIDLMAPDAFVARLREQLANDEDLCRKVLAGGIENPATRRKVLRGNFIQAAEQYLRSRVQLDDPSRRDEREQTKKLLKDLIVALHPLLDEPGAAVRDLLHAADDCRLGFESGSVEAKGALLERLSAEGRRPNEGEDHVARLFYRKWRENASVELPPVAWIQDYAKSLIAAAEYASSHPPLRRDKRDDAFEGLIRAAAWNFEWSTGRRPTVNNRGTVGCIGEPTGDFFELVQSLLRILEPRLALSPSGVAIRIRRALTRRPRGLFAST